MTSVKHGQLITDSTRGALYILDTSDLATLLQQPRIYKVFDFVPLNTSIFEVKEQRLSQPGGNTLALTMSPNGKESLVFFEYNPTPVTAVGLNSEPASDGWDFTNFKMPM